MCKLLSEKSFLFAALLLSAVSMSCSKDPQDTNSKQSGNNVHEWQDSTLSGDAVMGSAMTFKVGGGMSVERTAQTRATTNINGIATFTEGDLVAVAVTRSGGSETVKLYRVKNGGSLEYAGGDNDPFVWKSTGETVSLRAWSYGTSTNLSYTLTAPETRDYSLETDQQTNDYRELLYCKAANKSYSSGAISLNFYHQLARMVFNVTHESSSPLTISSVSIGGSSFPKMARFNVPTGSSNVGTWVVKSGTGSITPKTETQTTTGYLATYSAVVFPTFTTQNYPKDTPIFTVNSGTKKYTYKIAESGGMAYAGNTQYNYTINVRDMAGTINPDNLRYGDIIYDDGSIVHLNETPPTTTSAHPIGVVVVKYSSANVVCEAKAVNESGETVVGKAIVMALWDCGSNKGTQTAPYYQWGNVNFNHTDQITYNGSTVSLFTTADTYAQVKNDYYGYEKTYQMVKKPTGTTCATNNHTHLGPAAAYNFHTEQLGNAYSTDYLTGSTGWFLPSMRQWWEIVFSMCENGDKDGNNTYSVDRENGKVNGTAIPNRSSGGAYIKEIALNLQSLLTRAPGGTMLTNETNWGGDQANCYQSSTQTYVGSGTGMTYMMWSTTLGGVRWGAFGQTTNTHWRVRPVLCY